MVSKRMEQHPASNSCDACASAFERRNGGCLPAVVRPRAQFLQKSSARKVPRSCPFRESQRRRAAPAQKFALDDEQDQEATRNRRAAEALRKAND